MKKKIALIITAAIMVIATIVGGTMAAFQTATSTQNDLSAGNFEMALKQKGDVAMEDGRLKYTGLPGDIMKEEIWIENVADKDMYVRLTVSKSWFKSDGEKELEAECKAIRILNKDAEGNLVNVIDNESDDWIVIEADEYGEVLYCYYTKPIALGEKTGNLMDAFSVLYEERAEAGNLYEKLQSEIAILADAVQKTAAGNGAMKAEWGVVPTIENDKIIHIEEQ